MNFTSLSRSPASWLHATQGRSPGETKVRESGADTRQRRLGFTRLLPHAFRRREPLQTLAPVVIHVRAEEDAAPSASPAALRTLADAVRDLGTTLIMLLPLRDARVLATVTRGLNDRIARHPHYQAQRAAFDRLLPQLPDPLTTPAGRANARVEIARERARIQGGRDARQGEVVKFLAQGCDGSYLRLSVLREMDAESTRLKKASPLDRERLELLTRSRERIIQEGILSMAERAMDGGVTQPTTSSLRGKLQSGLALAQRAREQRHSLIKLAHAERESQRAVDALERRTLELDVMEAGQRHPMTIAPISAGEEAALNAMTQMGYGHNLQQLLARCEQMRMSVVSPLDASGFDIKALEDMLQPLHLPPEERAEIMLAAKHMAQDNGRAIRRALSGLAARIERMLRETLIAGALRI